MQFLQGLPKQDGFQYTALTCNPPRHPVLGHPKDPLRQASNVGKQGLERTLDQCGDRSVASTCLRGIFASKWLQDCCVQALLYTQ